VWPDTNRTAHDTMKTLKILLRVKVGVLDSRTILIPIAMTFDTTSETNDMI